MLRWEKQKNRAGDSSPALHTEPRLPVAWKALKRLSQSFNLWRWLDGCYGLLIRVAFRAPIPVIFQSVFGYTQKAPDILGGDLVQFNWNHRPMTDWTYHRITVFHTTHLLSKPARFSSLPAPSNTQPDALDMQGLRKAAEGCISNLRSPASAGLTSLQIQGGWYTENSGKRHPKEMGNWKFKILVRRSRHLFLVGSISVGFSWVYYLGCVQQQCKSSASIEYKNGNSLRKALDRHAIN